MKRTSIALIALLAAAPPALAAGLMKAKDPSIPPLQIRDHTVNVVINNGFAVTEVDQIFHNPHDADLEAIYAFPLPADASLSELSLWIDGQEVVGEVVEKEKARTIYEEEKGAGRETGLAEPREYYAFDVFVSPVRAGSDTRVRLLYLQPLEIDMGVGRYVYPLEEGRIDEETHAFWDRLPWVHGTFSFDCTIRSAYPVEEVRVKGYESLASVSQIANDTWTARLLDEGGGTEIDRDVVVYYRLDQTLPARVDLLAHREGEGDGTFLLVITPGGDLELIAEGVDWSIVLDTSGSMAGKIAQAVEAVSRALDHMRPEDRFRITTFSDRARPLVGEWTAVTPGTVEVARRHLLALESGGGTNLHGGFLEGLERIEEGRTSAVILVSDGGANVGPTGHRAFLKLLEVRDVRVFTFVVGQGANRPLLERLAAESGGFAMAISNSDDLYGRILQAKAKLAREALHGVKVEMDGVRVRELAPRRLGSAYYGQQIVLFGRYARPGEATLRLTARISGEEKRWETRVALPEKMEIYPELERLWALARVKEFQQRIEDEGKNSEFRQAVVDLGTRYSIVTDHTSMIVVRPERFEDLGLDRKNRDRVERERLARQIRTQQAPRSTRADTAQPIFNNRPAGGLSGIGAAGPELLALMAALLGARAGLLRRRDRR